MEWVHSFSFSLVHYQTNKPTTMALNKETAIPLTNSFQTFLPMIFDFSSLRIELKVP